jgi:hypothetical protein
MHRFPLYIFLASLSRQFVAFFASSSQVIVITSYVTVTRWEGGTVFHSSPFSFFPDDFALVPMEMNNLLAQAVDPRLFS